MKPVNKDQLPPYYLEQCKLLRDEIARRQMARNRLEEFTVLGVVAIYAWLSSSEALASDPNVRILGWLLPPIIIAISFIRQSAITKGIDRAAHYVEKLEALLTDERLIGWEKYVRENRKGDAFGGIRGNARLLWFLVFIACCTASGRATVIIMQTMNP